MAETYNPGKESVQVTASPNLMTERARFDPAGDSANSLANALGVAMPEVQKIYQRSEDEAAAQAKAYANSMTVAELGQKIKSGEMLPSQSPAYVATVQHIYGQNVMQESQRDILSKISRGELSFPDQASLDKYLVEHRNGTLAGQSKYTVAGFDKGWDQFGQTVMNTNARMNDAAYVARAAQESTDNLLGIVGEVSAKGFAGTPQEGATKVMQQFTLLSATGVLAMPDQKKAAWNSILGATAETGNKDLMAQLLAAQTPEGLSVKAIVGGERARTFDNAVKAADDGNQRQRVDVELRPFLDAAVDGDLSGGKRKEFDAWVSSNEPWVTTSTRQTVLNAQRSAEAHLATANEKAELLRAADNSLAAAQQSVVAAIASGSVAFMEPIKVRTKTGEERDFDVKKYAAEVIPRFIEGKNMPLEQQMRLWSTNGIQNPTWKNIVGGGVSNLASVGWASDGKNPGQLNEQGKAALETYAQLYRANPAEAESYAGEHSQLLGNILFLQERGGVPDINDAATLANLARQSGIRSGDAAIKAKQVAEAVRSITDPHLFSLSNNSIAANFRHIFGLAGNESLNFQQVASTIQRRAELLLQAGGAPDAASAVKASAEYIGSPAVTTKVNGTLYFNKDLPRVPQGASPGEMLERFIKAGPGEIAKEQGFGDGSTARLEATPEGGYMAWVGGVPLQDHFGGIVRYRRQDIEAWAAGIHTNEMLARAGASNLEAFSERLVGTNSKRGLLADYSTHMPDTIQFQGQYIKTSAILDRKNYARLQAEGVASGSIEEILQSTLNARKKK